MPSPMPLVEPVTRETLPVSREGTEAALSLVVAIFMVTLLPCCGAKPVAAFAPDLILETDHAAAGGLAGNARWLGSR